MNTAGAHLMNTYRRYPVTFVRGAGMSLFDAGGGEYLDFVAGIAVSALGHCHPAVAEAVARQAAALDHTSNLYFTEPMDLLANRLADLLGWPDGRVFFANSGAEANECAIKLIRKWARDSGREGAGIVAFNRSFHGRTMQTLAATGQPEKWEPFQPVPPGFFHIPYDDSPLLAAFVSRRKGLAAVLVEPVQGEAGVVIPSPHFLTKIRAVCDEHGLAMICDEVQTGLGRTGALFGFQAAGRHDDLAAAAGPPAIPDVVTLAKALGGGLPLGACVARGDLAGVFEPGDHATTMGGNPIACAAALAVLDVMEKEDLPSRAARTGSHLKGLLEEMAAGGGLVTGVRGLGLMAAVSLAEPVAREVCTAALERGLLINDVNSSTVRLLPPLIAGEADCEKAVSILAASLEAVGAAL